jgi:hypothetical protein
VVNGKIHLLGGATLPAEFKESTFHPRSNVSVGTHEVYDPATNTWTRRADMPTPRNHAAVGVVDGRIYMIGGRSGSVFIPNATNVDIVEEYDPAKDLWTLRQPMPTPRSASVWGTHNGRIYVLGRRNPPPRPVGNLHFGGGLRPQGRHVDAVAADAAAAPRLGRRLHR